MRESATLDLAGYKVAGNVRLGSGLIVLGRDLAEELGLSVGQTLRLQSSNGVTATLTLSGVFKTGNGGMDGARAFVSLSTARTLFSMPQGATGSKSSCLISTQPTPYPFGSVPLRALMLCPGSTAQNN